MLDDDAWCLFNFSFALCLLWFVFVVTMLGYVESFDLGLRHKLWKMMKSHLITLLVIVSGPDPFWKCVSLLGLRETQRFYSITNTKSHLHLRFRHLSGETSVNQLKLRTLHGDESYDVDKNSSTPCLESRPSPPVSAEGDSEPRSSSAPVRVGRRTR